MGYGTGLPTLCYLSMNKGSLFCSYEIHQTGIPQIVFLVPFASSQQGGVHGLGSMTFGLAVQKFLNIKWFFHWKLNCSWQFQRNCLWCCWKDLDEQDLMELILVRIGFSMWEILIFEWKLPLKIRINSKKTRFWKEKSVENLIILEGLPLNSSMISFHIWLFKNSIHTLPKDVHMLSFFGTRFTLGPTAHVTLVMVMFQSQCWKCKYDMNSKS